jgi:two-component system sensor histidine kinase AlgZ
MNRGEHDKPVRQSPIFLPDFCKPAIVLAVVLIAELTAMLIVLGRRSVHEQFWIDLAQTSLFLLWVGLGSAALLCLIRPRLVNVRARYAGIVSFAVMTGCAVLVAEAAYWLGQWWSGRTGAVSTLFPDAHLEFVLRTAGVAAIVSGLMLRYFYVSFEWKRNVESEARARVNALQARIRPHFLFNSMNTIAALTRSDPPRAEEAVEDLADLFRATLHDARSRIPLKEELELARIYQRIEQLRLGDRLAVEWHIDTLPLRARVPSLIVQPLLENAIYHGIEPSPAGGTVDITGTQQNGRVRITVSNPVPADPRPRRQKGNRIALDNIRERHDLAYPDRAELIIDTGDDRFEVTLAFPAEDNGDESTDR